MKKSTTLKIKAITATVATITCYVLYGLKILETPFICMFGWCISYMLILNIIAGALVVMAFFAVCHHKIKFHSFAWLILAALGLIAIRTQPSEALWYVAHVIFGTSLGILIGSMISESKLDSKGYFHSTFPKAKIKLPTILESKVDTLFLDVAHFAIEQQKISTIIIIRNFGVGYTRAEQLLAQLQKARVIEGDNTTFYKVIMKDIAQLEKIRL